ncbi:MAG: hypothetical protein FWD96_03355 [Defluviitaleaceae bacterium]|jgi:hypothetical protein|nr:hypothetical protein [Defluviitaleaceae bacterium]
MGMTDRQFESYQKRILRELERIETIIRAKGVKVEELNTLIADISDELKRP